MRINVEHLVFEFPNEWTVLKFDDSVFYRNQFCKMWQPIKAVDLIAASPDRVAYMIEVKDYRLAVGAGPSDLAKMVAKKVFDTLAAQIPCRLNANEEEERRLAERVCRCDKLVVVLHIEQPNFSTGIFRPYDKAMLQMKLRKLIKPIHAHPWVLQKDKLGAVEWTVE